jgi:methylmalonyl-CoA/ethylmalonyl-CoA epimerase
MLAKRPEGIVYHLCYESDNVKDSLSHMEKAGLRVFEVAEEKPAILFGGKPVSFYMVTGIGLIEIIGRSRK